MDRGRKMGRICSMGAAGAAMTFVLAGCAAETDVVMVCASSNTPEPIRVDDRNCDAPPNRYASDNYRWYSWQLPPTEYDDEGYGYYTAVVVPDVGRPIPRAQPGQATSGFVRATPGKAVVARAPAAGGPISRGGLGVGAPGGSSGS